MARDLVSSLLVLSGASPILVFINGFEFFLVSDACSTSLMNPVILKSSSRDSLPARLYLQWDWS